MKTCCPGCQTIFRVTTEQLRVRAGKVRCGTCRTAFNAINGLLDDNDAAVTTISRAPTLPAAGPEPATPAAVARPPEEEATAHALASQPDDETSPVPAAAIPTESMLAASDQELAGLAPPAAAENAAPPRETKELPDHSRWLEGGVSKPTLPADRSMTRPFAIVAVLLVVTLAGQVAFHFRSAIAVTVPVLRPALEALSEVGGSSLPLPRHAELVSIETSDLQNDPEHNKLLALQATIRNRASYPQAYPALELTLTDTGDKAVARRVFLPEQYLPPAALDDESFPASADVEIRLWFEARDIRAAGYRLYLFYP